MPKETGVSDRKMNTSYTETDVGELYSLLGESIWNLQHLEIAVTTFTAMKILQRKRDKGTEITEDVGERVLNKQRRQTLGPLINAAKRERIIPNDLIERFDLFLKERNWLIHKCVVNEYLSLRNKKNKEDLFSRILVFSTEAQSLKKEIYKLLERWYEQKGYDLEHAYKLAEKLISNAEKC